MPEHVGMNEKGELCGHARPGNHALISGCGKRCATFRDDEWGDVGASRRSFRNAGLSRVEIGCTLASPVLGASYVQAPSQVLSKVEAFYFFGSRSSGLCSGTCPE